MLHLEDHGFSEFEVEAVCVKFKGADEFKLFGCAGMVNEKLESKTIQKKCGGIVTKTKTKGTGNGELDVKLHVSSEVFDEALGLKGADLAEGVRGYGENSVHKEFCAVVKILNEDGVARYKAYPRCIITEFPERPVENGQTEVAESEMKLSIMPDEYGYGMYQGTEGEISEAIGNTWMSAFDADTVRKSPSA